MKPSEQLESPLTKVLAGIAQQKWQMYKDEFVPIENKFMGQVDAMNTATQYNRAGGLAESETMRQYDPVIQQGQQRLMEAGAAPNSGAFTAGSAGLRSAGAGAVGNAGYLARQGQQDRYRAGLETILGMGNGQAAMAQNSITDLANQSTEAAKQQTQNNWENKAATIRGIGTATGVLTSAGLGAVTNKR